jgi:hypothetical protein
MVCSLNKKNGIELHEHKTKKEKERKKGKGKKKGKRFCLLRPTQWLILGETPLTFVPFWRIFFSVLLSTKIFWRSSVKSMEPCLQSSETTLTVQRRNCCCEPTGQQERGGGFRSVSGSGWSIKWYQRRRWGKAAWRGERRRCGRGRLSWGRRRQQQQQQQRRRRQSEDRGSRFYLRTTSPTISIYSLQVNHTSPPRQ